jgi:hypothetical protein
LENRSSEDEDGECCGYCCEEHKVHVCTWNIMSKWVKE